MVKRLLKAMRRKKTVLIIDDEEDYSYFLKINLEKSGRYKVFTANNGEKGLQTIFKKKPDVVLLDIRMPGMDGFEVLEKIKENVKTFKTPVIMLTGVDNEASRSKASGHFAGEYLVKPVAFNMLISTIERVVVYGK